MDPAEGSPELERWRAARRKHDLSQALARTGWYHSFELPGGRTIEGLASLDALRARLAQMPIPEDLTGKRVLDIGAWDGWFSFEMERRGAQVVAVDCVEVENFRFIHQELRSKVDYRVMDVYELTPERIGHFDIVLFLGVLYHVKHPLLALEKICALTKELAVVDSFVIDYEADWSKTIHDLPRMELYETDELGGQFDNWFGPNLSCVMALCRTAGFARVEVRGRSAEHACLACYRQWAPCAIDPRVPVPPLTAAVHYRDYGLNFRSGRDDYICCWFDHEAGRLSREDVQIEVDGYGIQPISVRRREGDHWQANVLLPPGLEPGWREVRLRIGAGAWSGSCRIAVDFPRRPLTLRVTGAYDGVSWTPGRIQLRGESYVSMWVAGLPENADCCLVRSYLDDVALPVVYVEGPRSEPRQVNARVPDSVGVGNCMLTVSVEDARSAGFPVTVEREGAGGDHGGGTASCVPGDG